MHPLLGFVLSVGQYGQSKRELPPLVHLNHHNIKLFACNLHTELIRGPRPASLGGGFADVVLANSIFAK